MIHGKPTGGGATLNLYCIDINTDTTTGIGYELGSWDAGGVSPRVGYVARLLNDYYPHTDEPTALTDPNQKAAAVQAAIWFFSDRYVLNTSDSLHAAVVAIVNKVKVDGPLIQPPPPTLTITPPSVSGPAGSAVGPFTVSTNTGRRRRQRPRAPGTPPSPLRAEACSPTRQAHVPIANGATVPSGQQIWMRSSGGSSSAVLQAKATATVPSGNVYLYDGNSGRVQRRPAAHPGRECDVDDHRPGHRQLPARRLAGREEDDRRSRCRIAGAGRSSTWLAMTARTGPTSSSTPVRPRAPRRRPTATSRPERSAPSPRQSDGSTAATKVVVTGAGQQVTIPSGESKTVHVTNTYHFAGSLLVTKTIAGPAAGQQGEITIHTVCDGKALTPDL